MEMSSIGVFGWVGGLGVWGASVVAVASWRGRVCVRFGVSGVVDCGTRRDRNPATCARLALEIRQQDWGRT